MKLQPPSVSTAPMWFDHESGLLGVEASSLPRNLAMGRIYDDACDIGLTLVSHLTGKSVIVSYCSEVRDNDGDLLYHIFKPIEDAPFHELRVYND